MKQEYIKFVSSRPAYVHLPASFPIVFGCGVIKFFVDDEALNIDFLFKDLEFSLCVTSGVWNTEHIFFGLENIQDDEFVIGESLDNAHNSVLLPWFLSFLVCSQN